VDGVKLLAYTNAELHCSTSWCVCSHVCNININMKLQRCSADNVLHLDVHISLVDRV